MAKIFIINDTSVTGGADNTSDLGSSLVEWKDLYIDGLAYIDGLGQNLDAGDFDITSVDKLEGFDTGVFIDLGADGRIVISADGAGTPFSSPDIDVTGSIYFDDHAGFALDKQIQFGDAGVYIFSNDDGYLDLVADIGVRISGNTVITGTLGAGAITGTSFVVGAYSLSTEFQYLDGIGAYVYRAGGTDVPLTDGGTGQSTAQAAINALTAVSGATNEHVLTKDTSTGNAIFKAAGSAGANTALSNLASVELNTSIISDSDQIDDLGSAAKRFNSVHTVQLFAVGGSTAGVKSGKVIGHLYDNLCSLLGNGTGSFVQGYSYHYYSYAYLAKITASGSGAFARGFSSARDSTSDITASGQGSFASGFCYGYGNNAYIKAVGHGSFAHGYAYEYNLYAEGKGSAVFGFASTAKIHATAQNAFQFGVGTNVIADSLQVGAGSSIRDNGSIFLKEKAVDTADVAGWGQIWVKNTTPAELWFTDDAGTATKIA